MTCQIRNLNAFTWNSPLQGSQSMADYKLTTEEIVDDGISRTVGIYEPVGESEPCIHGFSVISILETPEDSADLIQKKVENYMKNKLMKCFDLFSGCVLRHEVN